MSLSETAMPGQLEQAAATERSLLWQIHAAAGDLERVECFDEEQRAEVHAILEAIKHESESHSAIVQFLVSRYSRDTSDA